MVIQAPVFSYKLRYMVGFVSVEMVCNFHPLEAVGRGSETQLQVQWKLHTISTNPEPTISYSLYENTGTVIMGLYIFSRKNMSNCLHLQNIQLLKVHCALSLFIIFPFTILLTIHMNRFSLHCKQYWFFRRNPSVLLPCHPRRTFAGFSWGYMVIVLKGSF